VLSEHFLVLLMCISAIFKRHLLMSHVAMFSGFDMHIGMMGDFLRNWNNLRQTPFLILPVFEVSK